MDIIKPFQQSLDQIKYNIITPAFRIEFNEEEKTFLKEEKACSKEIQKAALTGFMQKESFTRSLNHIKFIGASG